MKSLVCEMCGSQDLVKQDGIYVCQSCGAKYSVEEAKKMMVEGTVSVVGTVKVDSNDELNKLYVLARRAKDDDNVENACKFYNEILLKDPNSWEANFYSVFYDAASCKKGEIGIKAQNITNCLKGTIAMIISDINDETQIVSEIENIQKQLFELSVPMIRASQDVREHSYIDGIMAMLVTLGDCCASYGDRFKQQAISAYKFAVTTFFERACYKDPEFGHSFLYGFDYSCVVSKLKELEPGYIDPFEKAFALKKKENARKAFVVCCIIGFVLFIIGIFAGVVWLCILPLLAIVISGIIFRSRKEAYIQFCD